MIETIIKCKLEKDILNYFKNDKNYNYIQNNIQTYINNCINKDKLSYNYDNYDKQRTYYSRTIYKYDDSICFAKVWNNGYGGRCCRKIKNNDLNLCKLHLNVINKYDKLIYGFYNKPKPDINILTNKKLKWK